MDLLGNTHESGGRETGLLEPRGLSLGGIEAMWPILEEEWDPLGV